MTRLIYFRPSDEDQLPISPAAPLNLDEDSDAWWAGVQRCFVAIPLATTLAAVALSASLAFGYQQQTDDIVPQPAPTVVEDESWQVSTPPHVPAIIPSPQWDDEFPAGALFGQPDEEAVWLPPPPKAGAPIARPWTVDEEIVPQPAAFAQEEEAWPLFWPWARPPVPMQAVSADEEIVPQPLPFVAEEYWAVSTPPSVIPRPLYLPDPEEIPAGSLVAVQVPLLIVLSGEAATQPDVTGEAATIPVLSGEAATQPDVTGETFKPSG